MFADIGIGIGPSAEERAGGPTATSIDYQMEHGSDHTLYLKQDLVTRRSSTDACSGSHPGAPTADEERLFGPGRPRPATAGPPDRTPTGLDSTTTEDRIIGALATLLALVGGAAAIWYARRSARQVGAS